MKILLMTIMALALTSCGKKTKFVNTDAPTVPLTDIESIIEDENIYRNGLGQTLLTQGLSCTLYTITGGTRIQASVAGNNTLTGISQVATFRHNGSFNQVDSNSSEGMIILPEPLRSIYKNMYLLRCQGQVVITETGYYGFELTSDDASLLYINGAKLIDNDNAHSVTTRLAQKYLRRGVHSFRIDYVQNSGRQALVLTSNGASIPLDRFYR